MTWGTIGNSRVSTEHLGNLRVEASHSSDCGVAQCAGENSRTLQGALGAHTALYRGLYRGLSTGASLQGSTPGFRRASYYVMAHARYISSHQWVWIDATNGFIHSFYRYTNTSVPTIMIMPPNTN